MTTTTLPITITIEVSGTFVPGNLHKVRDEEPQGDTFEDLRIDRVLSENGSELLGAFDVEVDQESLPILMDNLIHTHREAIIEALLTERENSAP